MVCGRSPTSLFIAILKGIKLLPSRTYRPWDVLGALFWIALLIGLYLASLPYKMMLTTEAFKKDIQYSAKESFEIFRNTTVSTNVTLYILGWTPLLRSVLLGMFSPDL